MNTHLKEHTNRNPQTNTILSSAILGFLLLLTATHPATLQSGNDGSQTAVTTEIQVANAPADKAGLYYDMDARHALGVTASLIETYMQHALTSLRLIAISPATRSGIWPEIRPGLHTLCNAIPGAALYIEPDGNYYSVQHDYTGLNVSDREYFEPLFNGEEIHGSLIYSRSAGKQSVLMAVPVFEEDEVTGAVALSIFLDDFQQLISQSLNLSSDYLWYVIDEEAYTVLHPRKDFVFMNPLQQGSPSMQLALETITQKKEGYTSYVFAGRQTHILFRKLDFNDWRVVFGKIGEKVDDTYLPEAKDILQKISNSISEQLIRMDKNLYNTVTGFGAAFPPEHVARNAFRKLYQGNPYVISCALVDPDGKIVYIEPSDFYPSEGQNIRDHENYLSMQKVQAPMLSSSFLAVEGFDAVSLQHPVHDKKGNICGYVNLLIRPEIMVEELVTPYIAETFYDPWIIEPEGRIIFDKAFDGTGQMLFLDYLYEDNRTLLELGDQIAESESGQGDYIFIDPDTGERMVKMAIWDTIQMHGRQWRVILSYPPYD